MIFVMITAAAYTYYRSKSQENSLKSRGLLEDGNKSRRRMEIIIRVSITFENVNWTPVISRPIPSNKFTS